MSKALVAPANDAQTSEWIDWLQDLNAMPDSHEVKQAKHLAVKTVRSRQRAKKQPMRGSTSLDGYAFG